MAPATATNITPQTVNIVVDQNEAPQVVYANDGGGLKRVFQGSGGQWQESNVDTAGTTARLTRLRASGDQLHLGYATTDDQLRYVCF